VDQFVSPATATLVHSFTPDLGLLGITELMPNKFVVLSSNYSAATGTAPPGEFSAYLVDFTKHSSTNAIVSKIAQLPKDTALANGIATLNPDTVLISDSRGRLLALNTDSGKTSTVLEDKASMAPYPNPLNISIGINGLKYRDGYAYYTNIWAGGFYRLPVNCETARPTGPVETLSTELGTPDDFAFTRAGDAIVADGISNTVVKVTEIGTEKVEVEVVAGSKDQLIVPGGTAVSMGRRSWDRDTAYVSTNGGLAEPVNGTLTEGGKVAAVRV